MLRGIRAGAALRLRAVDREIGYRYLSGKRKGGGCMYLLALLAVFLGSWVLVWTGGEQINFYFDTVSLLLILIFCVLMLLATGLLSDFNNAFRFTVKKKCAASLSQLKRSVEAVRVVMSTNCFSSVFILAFSLVGILYRMEDPITVGPMLAVAFLSVVYGMGANLILLAVRTGLNIRIQDYLSEEDRAPDGIPAGREDKGL